MTAAIALGLAWGALVAAPVAARARRWTVLGRLPRPVGPDPGGAAGARGRGWAGPLGRVLASVVARRRARRDGAGLVVELPPALDLLQVAVGAGASPYRAVEVTAQWAPPLVAGALGRVLDAARLGDSLAAALTRLAVTHPPLTPLVDVLVASEDLGAPAGPALSRVADEVRADLRRRAEARARVLPVKLLFPLVFLVLPAFGLLTVVPALLSALARL